MKEMIIKLRENHEKYGITFGSDEERSNYYYDIVNITIGRAQSWIIDDLVAPTFPGDPRSNTILLRAMILVGELNVKSQHVERKEAAQIHHFKQYGFSNRELGIMFRRSKSTIQDVLTNRPMAQEEIDSLLSPAPPEPTA